MVKGNADMVKHLRAYCVGLDTEQQRFDTRERSFSYRRVTFHRPLTGDDG